MSQRLWLLQIREGKKMTHEKVAEIAGIQRAYYTQIENGVRTPSVNVAKKLAEALEFEWTIFFDSKCSEKRQNVKPA